jgi:hypothetical protein
MPARRLGSPVRVAIEATAKRTFATALDWPGWSRSGKTEGEALDTLAAYAPRYAVATAEAGTPFHVAGVQALRVVEHLDGNATTTFGVPAIEAEADAEPLTAAEARRRAALVAASWVVLERVAAGAPASLRKGPRGGGRDRDAVVAHVWAAENAYAGKMGLSERVKDPTDRTAVEALHAAMLTTLRSARDGAPLRPGGWTPRYAAQRVAWHALDHAWEIEDRSSD